jgi:hypothetical protein
VTGDLVALDDEERRFLTGLVLEHRSHVIPSERAELDRIRDVLDKLSELEPVA